MCGFEKTSNCVRRYQKAEGQNMMATQSFLMNKMCLVHFSKGHVTVKNCSTFYLLSFILTFYFKPAGLGFFFYRLCHMTPQPILTKIAFYSF